MALCRAENSVLTLGRSITSPHRKEFLEDAKGEARWFLLSETYFDVRRETEHGFQRDCDVSPAWKSQSSKDAFPWENMGCRNKP